MALKNIIGHTKQIAQLRRAIQSGRVPNAYLFFGAGGVGKSLVAENIAKILNCQNPTNPQTELDACEECNSCKKISNKTHPDVRIVEPDGEHIKVEQLRDVLRGVSFKPYEGRWKIVIFDKAEMLLPSAGNLFLKTLEEPTNRTLFILLSSRQELLLPTIVSRCQRVRFGGLPSSFISDILKKEFKLEDEDARFYSLMAEGSISRGKSMVAGDWKKNSENYLASIQKFVFSADIDSSSGVEQLFSLCEKLSQEKETLPLILDLLRSWYRDLIIWSATNESSYLLHKGSINEIKNQSTQVTINELYRRLDLIEKASTALEFNANKQLALENMFIESLDFNSGATRCL